LEVIKWDSLVRASGPWPTPLLDAKRSAESAFAGAASLSPFLASCGSDDGGGNAGGVLLPEELDIETIIVVMMENRSFDHYFGSLSLLEGSAVNGLRPGFSNPRSDDTPVASFQMALRCVADPPHGFDSSHNQVNNGANDGFVREHAMRVGNEHGDEVMGYHVREQLPFLYALADEFALCQSWHCSVLGPTWPNRFYLNSAQSNGRKNNTVPLGGATWPTIYDRLDDAGIPWKSYFSDLALLALWPKFLLRPELNRIEEFYEDARSGQLPPFCQVEPAYTLNDDHPPHDIRLGQAFLSSIIHAVGQGPQWDRSLIIVTYDENGGFLDHVAPGKVADERADEGFDQLGIRVPGLVISPYTPAGLVSSTLYEHSSVPAFVEWLYGLAPLTVRDANANIFLDTIDARQVRRADPRPFPELPVVDVDPETPVECAAFAGGGSVQDIERYADAGGIPRSLDLRRETPQIMQHITRELIRMGAGRRVRYK
jgi:phospholipase C